MNGRRIIACLDVKAGRVVKGVRFRGHVDVGPVTALAARYREQGADELVLYDIGASPAGQRLQPAMVTAVADLLDDTPLCVAGGIDSVAAARTLLDAGARRISVNSLALMRPRLIAELADAFGSERIVVGIDSQLDDDGEWRVRSHSGDPAAMRAHARRTLDWIEQAQAFGAGEIVLNCMQGDGTRQGYDIAQLRQARAACRVPLVASGGAGCMADFAAVFAKAQVDGALAASVFHDGTVSIPELKAFLAGVQTGAAHAG